MGRGYIPVALRQTMSANQNKPIANPSINISQTYLDLQKSINPIAKEGTEIYKKYIGKWTKMRWSSKYYKDYQKIIKSDIYKEKRSEYDNLMKKIEKTRAQMRLEFNKVNSKLKSSDINQDFIKNLNDKELNLLNHTNVYNNRKFKDYSEQRRILDMVKNEQDRRLSTAHFLQLKNNPEEKHKLTKEYLQELEDNYKLTSDYKFESERNLILSGLTNKGENTKKLPLNEQFDAIINRIDGGIRPSDFNENEKEKFANHFFANRDAFSQIIDMNTKKRRPIEYLDFYEYMPSSLTKKVSFIDNFPDYYWESASSLIRQTAYDKNLNRYDGKENTYEVLDRIRKKNPLVKALEDPYAFNVFDYMRKTPQPLLIIPSINKTYEFANKIDGIIKNEWNDYKKEKGFRFYDELSGAEKNVLRSTR